MSAEDYTPSVGDMRARHAAGWRAMGRPEGPEVDAEFDRFLAAQSAGTEVDREALDLGHPATGMGSDYRPATGVHLLLHHARNVLHLTATKAQMREVIRETVDALDATLAAAGAGEATPVYDDGPAILRAAEVLRQAGDSAYLPDVRDALRAAHGLPRAPRPACVYPPAGEAVDREALAETIPCPRCQGEGLTEAGEGPDAHDVGCSDCEGTGEAVPEEPSWFSPAAGQAEWENSPESDPSWVQTDGASWSPDDPWDVLTERLAETLDEDDTSNAVQIVRAWIGEAEARRAHTIGAAVEAGVRAGTLAARGDAAAPTVTTEQVRTIASCYARDRWGFSVTEQDFDNCVPAVREWLSGAGIKVEGGEQHG